MNRNISLSEKEANSLLVLINIAVKSAGLDVAESALYFKNKIHEAFNESEDKISEEQIKES